jgi:hypothetical protein
VRDILRRLNLETAQRVVLYKPSPASGILGGGEGGNKRSITMAIFANYAVNGNNPSTVGGAGTGLFYFPSPPSANAWNAGAVGVNTAISSNQQGGTPSATNYTGQLSVPGRGILNGQRFSVSASGNALFAVGEASTTATIKINLNNGTIATPVITDLLGTSVQLSTSTAGSGSDNVYYPWSVVLTFEGDSQSGVLQISKTAIVNGVLIAPTAVTAVTGINFYPGQQPPFSAGFVPEYAFGLAVGIQFGASAAGNSANLFQFQLNGD